MSLVAAQEAKVEAGDWSPPRGRVWGIEDARRMKEAWRRSGEKVGTFARRHGVGAERLRWWLRRLEQQEQPRPQATPVRFAPVRLVSGARAAEAVKREKESPQGEGGGLEVLVAGKRVIRVGRHFDAALLRQVVAALEEEAC